MNFFDFITRLLQGSTQPKIKEPKPVSTVTKVEDRSSSRMILHWTAGRHTASYLDKKHYHFLIEGDGTVVKGYYKPEANESTRGGYAAHTRMKNTGSIGISLCAMAGAEGSPFKAGKYPITKEQVEALCSLIAELSVVYDIPITERTVLSHAEVEKVLGVKQRGKWDISWLPHYRTRVTPSEVGHYIRKKAKTKLSGFSVS